MNVTAVSMNLKGVIPQIGNNKAESSTYVKNQNNLSVASNNISFGTKFGDGFINFFKDNYAFFCKEDFEKIKALQSDGHNNRILDVNVDSVPLSTELTRRGLDFYYGQYKNPQRDFFLRTKGAFISLVSEPTYGIDKDEHRIEFIKKIREFFKSSKLDKAEIDFKNGELVNLEWVGNKDKYVQEVEQSKQEKRNTISDLFGDSYNNEFY